jgi:hypothetical protein
LLTKYQQTENKTLPSLPILPLPIIDGSHIKVLVDTRDPTVSPTSAGIIEANNVNFSDEEVHHSKYDLVECVLLSVIKMFSCKGGQQWKKN